MSTAVEVTGDPDARRKFEEYRKEQRALDDEDPTRGEMFNPKV